jgi:hypothetical protein
LNAPLTKTSGLRNSTDPNYTMVDRASPFMLYVNVATLARRGDLCVSSYRVELSTFVEGKPRSDVGAVLLNGPLGMIDRGGILSSRSDEYRGRVASAVSGIVTDITTRVRLAEP